MKQPKRGEIYFFDFSPSKGREIKGSHPALIIQNDGFVFPNEARNLVLKTSNSEYLVIQDGKTKYPPFHRAKN